MNRHDDYNEIFHEIEYDSHPIKTSENSILKPQKLASRKNDKHRQLFYSMRDIARLYASPNMRHSRFFDKRVQQDNARVFYEQAMFMKDFEDDYPEHASFSAYFPYYQMLSYEQLRTYFTWRTQVRKGVIDNTSLSYVFLYLYEL